MNENVEDLDWRVIYEGDGAVDGGNWFEEVTYLGNERWLIRLYDDPAWAFDAEEPMEPEEKSTEELVAWVRSIDSANAEDAAKRARERALLEAAKAVGDKKCVALLTRSLSAH